MTTAAPRQLTILEARERSGLSRERVAARLEISAKTLERWEKGVTRVKRYRLLELADVYGLSVGDLHEAQP